MKGGEKSVQTPYAMHDSSKIAIALTYFSENKKSGISYVCLYNHATKITPSGSYHNGTLNGNIRREYTTKVNIYFTTSNKKSFGSTDLIIKLYIACNPSKKFLLNRYHNSYSQGCQKNSNTLLHSSTIYCWSLSPFV